MGLFSRNSAASAEPRIPAAEEIGAAGRALARGNDRFADQLCDEAGPYRQSVAMEILAASADYTPQD
ncbi:hypothetical protein [Streptomyces sp. NPDC005969]|uniref:hypothetical protein n=1 Tax=Streptomyces sp. NPDC005969 TaxID=3156722 RepID=UPI0033F8C941